MANPDWAEKLEQEYIHLFEVYEGETTEKSYYKKGQVLRGIECSSGWEKHIKRFLDSCNWHLEHNAMKEKEDGLWEKDPDAKIQIFQIKNKFGYVRCYAKSNNARLDALVDQEIAKLEARCELTCEACGFVGEFERGQRYSSVCPDCRKG